MRQYHRAGEKVFIDHCGPTMPVIDRRTGEQRQAQIFVAVLGASSYTYAEATWTQGLEDWIASNTRMLEFFDGVPELLIPDNLRSASTKCRYEPQVNETYLEFARLYTTAVLPTRPRKPYADTFDMRSCARKAVSCLCRSLNRLRITNRQEVQHR